MRPPNIPAVVAVVLTLSALGCSAPPQPASDAPAPGQPAASTPQASRPASAAPQPTAPAPLASAESEQPGLRVEIQELKRTDGDTLTLRLAFLNTSGRTQFTVGHLNQANLIDTAGKKKSFVVEDAAGACVCSRDLSLDADARANMWAKFPAPPGDVQKITVVVPQFQPLEGIPIIQ